MARTGVYVDDYVEFCSSLPSELQRLLSTMRELDDRSQNMMVQTREQVRACLMKKRDGVDADSSLDMQRQQIEANQTNTLKLCTEKVLLAQQAYDLIETHMKRLDEDLNSFAEDLKQEGKVLYDEPYVSPFTPKDEKRKLQFLTPVSKRLDSKLERDRGLESARESARETARERERDRDRDRDSELMPPPGSQKKKSLPAPTDVDQPIDPNEPTYCTCGQVSFGDMIACDNEKCEGGEWFHYQCVGLSSETRFKGKWYCPHCRSLQRRGMLDVPT